MGMLIITKNYIDFIVIIVIMATASYNHEVHQLMNVQQCSVKRNGKRHFNQWLFSSMAFQKPAMAVFRFFPI